MSDAKEIKDRLLTQIESVCAHLLPNGKLAGHEFRASDVNGGAGKSLAVEIKGSKRGVWKDFGTGATGDILELWMQTQNVKFPEALDQARKFLGIVAIDRPKPKTKPHRPSTTGLVPLSHSPALNYLQNERAIHPETAILYKVFGHGKNAVRTDKEGKHSDYLFSHNETFLAFSFIDAEGDPVMLKSTGIKKRKDKTKDIWSTKPHYTLWGWWTVSDNDRSIIICEGEIDAMSLYQLDPGFPVLSMPAGASNLTWIENDYHALQRFEKIYILTDQDNAGELAASEIAKRLGRARCSRIPLPGKYKDANEVLTKGQPEELEIHEWIKRAFSFDPPSLQQAGDFRAKAHAALVWEQEENKERTFIFPSLDFQYRDGETTLLSGYPGHGKSEFLYQSHVHEMIIGNKVCIASLEIPPAHMLLHMATQITGKQPNRQELDNALDWLDGKLWFYAPETEDVKWKDLIEDFRYCAQRFGTNRFIVDSLHFLCRKEEYEDQDAFVKTLCRFGKIQNVHCAVVAHSLIKKGEGIIPKGDQVEGSGGIIKPIDNGLTFWRNIEKEEKIEQSEDNIANKNVANDLHDGYIVCWKQRSTGKRFRKKLWFDPSSRRFRLDQSDINAQPVTTNAQIDWF